MTRDKQDAPGQRDSTLARLMTDALEVPLKKQAAGAAPCPDAEILAVYADHSLDAGETARWETHFADCPRCQKILALLAVTAEEPLTKHAAQPIERLPDSSVAPIASAPYAARPAKHSRSTKPLRWLVPALGIAAAVTLWFAVRPSARSGTEVAQTTAQKMAAQPAPGLDAQTTQMAEANVPPPPGTSLQSAGSNREPQAAKPSPEGASLPSAEMKQGLRDQAKKTMSSAPAQSAARNSVREDALQKAAPTQLDATGDTASTNNASKDQPIAPASSAPEGNRVASAERDVQSPASANRVPLTARAMTAGAPAPPPAPPSAQATSGVGGALAQNKTITPAHAPAAPLITFSTPDLTAMWRAGTGGRIERSSDRGQTWTPQPSGVTTDLLAGSAVSGQIAWIVGRSGVILRTTDGEHWQRVTPPPPPADQGPDVSLPSGQSPPAANDWTGVHATDALHAVINSRDLRQFSTADGGRTWTPQP